MKRNDVHRPSAIEPSQYSFVACDYPCRSIGDAPFCRAERARFAQHMALTGGKFSGHEHGGTCCCCGASAIYLAIFHHAETNAYIKLGERCAAKLDMGEPEAFRRLRKEARAIGKAIAGKKKAREILGAAKLEAAWDVFEAGGAGGGREEGLITNIVQKLVRYGSLSEKQTAFVAKLLVDISIRAEREAKRAEEKRRQDESAASCPTGRVAVTGTIVSKKVVETNFGDISRMLVRDDSGFKVWGTVPSALYGIKPGERVTFSASIEPSKDDRVFGFFKRPTKAQRDEQQAEAR